MKLSVWSSYYIDLSPEEAIRAFAEQGFHHCELSGEHALMLLERGDPNKTGRAFGDFAASHGVSVTQGHMFLHAHLCKQEHRELLCRQIDLFCAIGIQNAVLHCDRLTDEPSCTPPERQKRNLEAIRELVAYIGDHDLCICLENLSIDFVSTDDLLCYVEEIGSEHLGICLDTGHLNISAAQTQTEFIRHAGTRLRALHIADNNGTSDQHILPFSLGKVDVAEVIRQLKGIGYRGLYNLEIPGERKAPLEIRAAKLEYIKRMFGYLDSIT